uniref:Reverse transcriptase domain-containing protein n=1 Tax=Neogobius melanostomus TaxID=47308 RepID=A0A8C6UMS7_9GOBI
MDFIKYRVHEKSAGLYCSHTTICISVLIWLMELMNDKNIVIKPADKGGGICIQDADKYREEILLQLADTRFYRKLTQDPTVSFQKKLLSYLEDAKINNWISESDFDFLYCKFPVCPVMYTLPKIHKSLTDPPGRPIVAQTDSLWSPLSTFVDYFIKPYVQTLPAYVKDSTDFIEKCSSIINLTEDTFLLTLDISSLYTHIPHEGGLEALRFYLQDRSDESYHPNQLIDLAEFVMKYNYFTFESDFYLQTSGTSMGTVCAPNYANLYVGFFENRFVFNPIHNKYYPNIMKWFRYIDIFCMFKGSLKDLEGFLTLLNQFDPNLTFTAQWSREKVCFLDMWVKRNHDTVITSLYRKETDKNTLLLASSFHPVSLKKGLPMSQFLRLRRICHSTEDFINQATDMKMRFEQRGYPKNWIDDAYLRALNKT